MTDTTAYVIILSTFPADQDATQLATSLVDERLAACVNVLPPMQSIYRWQGNVEKATEVQLIIKTLAAKVEAVKARLDSLHPYDVPEVLVLPITGGSERYLGWLQESA